MRDEPAVDVVDKEQGVLIKKSLAQFHEFLRTNTFDFTNMEVKTNIFPHEEI
jgi:hypothetical protein